MIQSKWTIMSVLKPMEFPKSQNARMMQPSTTCSGVSRCHGGRKKRTKLLIGAISLDVASFFTLVANAITSSLFLGAALGCVSTFSTVVALLAGAAIAAHVAKSTARKALRSIA